MKHPRRQQRRSTRRWIEHLKGARAMPAARDKNDMRENGEISQA
jgi:hypothetical protein